MELLLTLVLTAVSAVVGVLASWYITRHYYLKSRAEETASRAFVQAIRASAGSSEQGKSSQEPVHGRGSNPDNSSAPAAPSPKSAASAFEEVFPLRWVLAVLKAYRNNEIYFPQVLMAGRMLLRAGRIIEDIVEEANNAVPVRSPDHPPSMDLWHDALRQAFERAYQRLQEELPG